MNNARRKIIRSIIAELQTKEPNWDWVEEELSGVLDEEEEVRDNMEEHFSETERYQIVSDNCDSLQDAIDAIDPDDAGCAKEIISALQQIDGMQ